MHLKGLSELCRMKCFYFSFSSIILVFFRTDQVVPSCSPLIGLIFTEEVIGHFQKAMKEEKAILSKAGSKRKLRNLPQQNSNTETIDLFTDEDIFAID